MVFLNPVQSLVNERSRLLGESQRQLDRFNAKN